MSQNKNYITKETKKKFDNFIQDSINKFFFVDPWDELYNITQSDHHQIISDQSTIPDLVIYNKKFNKNICFLYSNPKTYVKFPRKQFILRAVPTKEYNPTCTFPNQTNENLEKNNEDNKIKKNEDIKEDFVFKSIPKELEIKYNTNTTTQTKNDIFDELKEFMDNKNDNKNENNSTNINNINNNQVNNNVNNSNNATSNNQFIINNNLNNNNQGKASNVTNFGGKDFEKMRQKIFYDQQQAMLKYQQFLYYKQYNTYLQQQNNNNNLQPNKFNQFTQMNPINQNILYSYLQNKQISQNNQSNLNNQNIQNNNINLTNYYNTGNKPENREPISDLNEIVNKNKSGKNWVIKSKDTDQEKLSCNSQELYYFLNNAIKNNESLDIYKVIDKEFDMYCEPTIVYEALKSVFQKPKEDNKEVNKEGNKEDNKEVNKEDNKEDNKEVNKEDNKEGNKEGNKEDNKEVNKEVNKEEEK